MITLDLIYKASTVLKDVVRRTQLIPTQKINTAANVFLKPENLQVTGSFKVRGAGFKISQLSDEEKAHGVIACSAGNHAQGVALAAKRYGIPALICMPSGAPISKVEATRELGAEVCLVPGVYDDAYAKAMQLSKYLCQLCFVSLYTSQMSQSRYTVILYFFGQCCRIAYRAAACAIGNAHIGRLAGRNPVDNLQTVLQLCALLRRKQLARQMNFTVF